MQGVSGFLFGFLPKVKTVGWFIGLSYLLRFLEGMGTAMAWSAALGILMKIFPNKVSGKSAPHAHAPSTFMPCPKDFCVDNPMQCTLSLIDARCEKNSFPFSPPLHRLPA